MAMQANCYICEKRIKLKKSRYSGVSGAPQYQGEYFVKTGFFSKDTIRICTNCDNMLSDLYGSRGWSSSFVLSEEGKTFIKKNKDKILSNDLDSLPKCKFCSKESNRITSYKCEKCECEYCNFCIAGDDCPNCYDELFTNPIIELLKDKNVKMTITDISAFIKQDREEVKYALEWMFEEKKVNYNGNGRYFILNPDKKKVKSKKSSAPKSKKVDIEKELEKLKGLLDKGLITQEQYDAKSNKLLGL